MEQNNLQRLNPTSSIVKYLPVVIAGVSLLTLSIYWFAACNSRTFLAFALLATCSVCVLVFLNCRGLLSSSKKPSQVFAGVLIFFSIAYTFAFPPLTVPDEAHHFYSSYWLADVITGQTNNEGFLVKTRDWELFSERNDDEADVDDYRRIFEEFEFFQSDPSEISVDYFQYSFGSENPPAKIATTLAILIGKGLNLGTYPLFYLGRLFNAACFIVCTVFTYRLMPFGKNAVVALSLLPMTLHLTASFSYDVGIISLGMLVTALMLKAIFEKGPLSPHMKGVIVITSMLLAPCKVIYSTVILLAVFIPTARFKSKRDATLFKLLVFALPAVMVLFLRLASIGDLTSADGSLDTRGTETGHFYELSFIFEQPLDAISLLIRTFLSLGDFYWGTFLGRSLGWFQADIAVPYYYCIPLLLGIVYAVQRDSTDDVIVPTWMKICFVVLSGLSFLGAVFSMFLGHTFDTEPVIQGVQGRYLLPAALPMFLALRSKYVSIERDTFPPTIVVFSITNVVFLLHIVASILM